MVGIQELIDIERVWKREGKGEEMYRTHIGLCGISIIVLSLSFGSSFRTQTRDAKAPKIQMVFESLVSKRKEKPIQISMGPSFNCIPFSSNQDQVKRESESLEFYAIQAFFYSIRFRSLQTTKNIVLWKCTYVWFYEILCNSIELSS